MTASPAPEWTVERVADELRAALAAHKHIPKWPLDRPPAQPVEGEEDLLRVRGAGLMAAFSINEGMRKQAAMDKLVESLNSSLNGFGVQGFSAGQLMAMAGHKVEDHYGDACQTALQILLRAPGAPSSWSATLPGGGSAIDFLPNGKAKAVLIAYDLQVSARGGEPDGETNSAAPAVKSRAPRL